MDIESLRIAIAKKIEEYLAGDMSFDSLRQWARHVLDTEDIGQEVPSRTSYWIVQDGLWSIILLDPSEPEDYRTTRQDLVESIAYLRGDIQFPEERIRRRDLKELRLTIADKVEQHLAGQLPLIALAAWAISCEEYVERLERPNPLEYQIVKHGLEIIHRMTAAAGHQTRPSRRDILLAIRYLKGTVTFPKGLS